MGKLKNYQNLWLLLALPVGGAVGWAIVRLISGRNIKPEKPFRVSEQTPEKAVKSAGTAAPMNDVQKLPSGYALRDHPEAVSLFYVLLVPFLILATAVIALVFYRLPVQSQSTVPGGDIDRGKAALQIWGCGACHTIPGVTGANGQVGPALKKLSDRSFIAGHLQNTPDNMIRWIMQPQQVSPGVDMPDTGVPESAARDMAAYLYSIH